MEYIRILFEDVKQHYVDYYRQIGGGIDGYYERTIVDADVYELYDNEPVGCFTIHKDRGLTSFVFYNKEGIGYHNCFQFILGLPIVKSVLFTENDIRLMESVRKEELEFEIQSYNFYVTKKIFSSLEMIQVLKEDIPMIQKRFNEFISYNNINLDEVTSFYYKQNNDIICFGALEPLRLNQKRYCISMIVNEAYRNMNYGSETVKFLIQYLQENNLEANARCYVENEVSKKTLLKSGMDISNKLYKVNLY